MPLKADIDKGRASQLSEFDVDKIIGRGRRLSRTHTCSLTEASNRDYT